MKKTLMVLIVPLFLTGCMFDDDDVYEFPAAAPSLLEACPSLKDVPANTVKLSEVITVVTDNYFKYHECRIKVDLWIEWYKTQKKIFEAPF